MRTILVTVGTSLLTNAQRILGKKNLTREELANYLRTTPAEKASAETNSLSRLLQKKDRLIFLCSTTEEGKLCAEVLKKHYEKEHSTEIQPIQNLTYSQQRFKMQGLRSLVETLADCIQKEQSQNRKVLINATGGFKAEIAYATLVGLLFNIPVYYLHERFQDIIAMPPVAVNWDFSLWFEYEDFFKWLEEDFRSTQEVERRLSQIDEPDKTKIRLLLAEEKIEGKTYLCLSPAGDAFFWAYNNLQKSVPKTTLFLSEAAYKTYQNSDPTLQKDFHRLLEKLRIEPLRQIQTRQVANSDCFVYPRGRQEGRVFSDSEEQVRVCELARHGKNYEELLKQGVYRHNYQATSWHPWPLQ